MLYALMRREEIFKRNLTSKAYLDEIIIALACSPFSCSLHLPFSTSTSSSSGKKKPPPAIPACLAFTFYTVSHEEHHEGEKPERTYTNVRSKPFPWGEGPLFQKKGGHH